MSQPQAVSRAFSMRTQFVWMAVLTGILIIGPFLPSYTFTTEIGEYDALHTMLEFASISISVMVFALAWNLRHQERNFALLVLGLTSLAVSLVDIGHVLSYQGMPEVITPSGPQKSITFWLVGRLIAAIGLLVIAIVRSRQVSLRTWIVGVIAVVAVVVAAWWIGMTQPDWLPSFYITGSGLTGLKKVLEYSIAGVLVVAAALFIRRALREHDREMAWLAAATWTLALTELYFTFYANVTDVLSVIAHVYKAIAYAMIYLAIFAAGVRRPYAEAAHDRSLLRSLIDSMPDLVAVKSPTKQYLVVNTAFQKYEDRPEQDFIGRTSGEVIGADTASIMESLDDEVLQAGSTVRTDVPIPGADGAARVFDTIKAPFRGPEGEQLGVISLSRDITEQREVEAQVEHLSHYDPLTGLPNQSLLAEATRRELTIAGTGGESVAFVLFDIDDFHTVNDAIGHHLGDTLLQQVGAPLRTSIRPRDVLARPGGDEFVALLVDQSPGDTALAVARLLDRTRQPFDLGERSVSITASAGIAMYPTDGRTYEELRRYAEVALYRAKSEGRDTARFFTDEMQQHATVRMQTLNDLRSALENGEFRVHYQPKVRLDDGSVCGAEALVRWEHPMQGLVSPAAFIPLAEETGLIVPIGDWVAQQALADAQAWRAEGLELSSMSLNLSATQFREADLAMRLTQIANDSGFPFADIEWELTESATMLDPEGSVAIIQSLHDRGFQVSLDDFGTGYSSMAYLKRYHIDTLKIDQSFVRDLAVDEDDRSIVRTVIQLARSMGCTVIAEGVETQEQLAVLREDGCDMAQGYLFSRPLPAAAMVEFLRAHRLAPVD